MRWERRCKKTASSYPFSIFIRETGAEATGAWQLHVMAGIADRVAETEQVHIDNIHHAADRLSPKGFQSMTNCSDRIDQIQIAGVPDRHEPDTCELNYSEIFRHMDEIGYGGRVGCKYTP
ncbi:hydroxypyruvate isomerase [Labrenzia sp. EL_13]|nr:hydroxypyruvate isomerase [Labrenzia sp. EL_13]